MTAWSILVKTVGNQALTPTDGTFQNGVSKPSPTNFTVQVAPNDSVLTLHKNIEDITGLKASQQRLIYRGKLISSGTDIVNNTEDESSSLSKLRMCDIDGLNDGQTIHLVPRPVSDSASSANRADSVNADNSSSDAFDPGSSISAEIGTAGFLSALLGLGTSGMIPIQAGEINLGDLNALRQARPGTRAARSVARRRRVNAHRRVATDPKYPQPGPLEPVRQGIMTMHTMIESEHRSDRNCIRHPLETPRRFYRGQWIDARDTVNQWCEATIVEVVPPEAILKIPLGYRCFSTTQSSNKRKIIVPPADSAVGANDLEGRRRLLLEPCDNEFDCNMLAQVTGDESLNGFRERSTNVNVQLLLIHYNGWPHRWDEWIRSDSERIRPFRTRTKSSAVQSSNCPIPQNSFDAAPTTHIVDEEDSVERPYMIPELQRALTMVSDLFTSAIHETEKINEDTPTLPSSFLNEIKQGLTSSQNVPNSLTAEPVEVKHIMSPWLDSLLSCERREENPDEAEKVDDISNENKTPPVPRYNKRKLELLAPLLDRLGRVLLDAAPHVAAFAETLPSADTSDDYLGSTKRTAISSSTPLLSQTFDEPDATESEEVNGETVTIDPDHIDYANGFINFLNPEGMLSTSVRRNIRHMSSSGSGSAAEDENVAPTARFIRLGSGNAPGSNGGTVGGSGGGIDIHIHAIVTGGVGGGLPLLNGFSNFLNDTATRTNLNGTSSSNIAVENPVIRDEDDLGLFSNLYSDAPSTTATTTHDTTEIVDEVCSNNADDDVDATISLPIRQGNSEFAESFSNGIDGSNISYHNSLLDEEYSPLLRHPAEFPSEIQPVDLSPAAIIDENENNAPSEQLLNDRSSGNSVETQTGSNFSNGTERPSPRSSLALVFRRALGRSTR